MMERLGISNIAWASDDELNVAGLLTKMGISFVEIAPTKINPDLSKLSAEVLLAYRQFWEDKNIKVHAMQSLFFGQKELNLFGSTQQRLDFIAHFKRVITVGASLGAKILVFGSPKNRVRGQINLSDAMTQAKDVFGTIANYALSKNICVCIEANPIEYGCDFINTTDEAAQLVNEINCHGFGLHLDIGTMLINGEDIEKNLIKYGSVARHCHLSAPQLIPLATYTANVKYKDIYNLCIKHLSCLISIEMKLSPDPFTTVRESLELFK